MPVIQLIGVSIVFFCAGYTAKCAKDMDKMREELRERRKQEYDRIIATNCG
jgi:peroxiredoxin